MLFIVTDVRGCSPIGSSVCRHRQPRMACASMPKGRERSIHDHCISCHSTCSMRWKSNPRYIHQSIAPPSTNGSRIFMILLSLFIMHMQRYTFLASKCVL